MNHDVAQFAADLASTSNGGGAVHQRAHAKGRACPQRERATNSAAFHDFSIGSDDNVSHFRVQGNVAQHRPRREVNALERPMDDDAGVAPGVSFLLLKGAQPPRQLESVHIARQSFPGALKQRRRIVEHVRGTRGHHFRGILPASGDLEAVVFPCLAIGQGRHHCGIGCRRQQPRMHLDMRFGLQQIFPLICNRPHPKVKRVLVAQDVQRVQVGGRKDLHENRCCHIANL